MKRLMILVAAVSAAVTVVATPKVAHFKGKAGRIAKGGHYADLRSFTATAWVKNPSTTYQDSYSASGVILSQGAVGGGALASGFALFMTRTNVVCFQIRDTNDKTSSISARYPDIEDDNTWHFLAVTLDWDRKVQRLYCDGVLKAEATGDSLPDPAPAEGTRFSIGSRHLKTASGGDSHEMQLKGSVAQVTLWNRALDSSELRSMMFSRAHGSEPGIVGCWSLNGELSDAASPAHHLEAALTASDVDFFEDAPDYPLARENALTLTTKKGSQSYIKMKNFPALRNFTVCGWVRNPDEGIGSGASDSGVIFSQGALGGGVDGFAVFRFGGANASKHRISFQTRTISDSSNKSLSVDNSPTSDGKWHFLSVTHDWEAKVKRIYWDGVLAAEATGTDNLPDPSTTRKFVIGAREDMNGNIGFGLNGSVAHVSLWNRALAESEIRQLIHRDPYGNETNLLGYWPIDEVSGTTIYDRSANGNDGTLVGSRYFRGENPYPFSVAGTAANYNGAGVLSLTSVPNSMSYVKTGKTFKNLTNFTACAWVRNPSVGNHADYGMIFSQGSLAGGDGGFGVYRSRGSALQDWPTHIVSFQTRSTSAAKSLSVTNSPTTDGKWHFLSVTHDYGAKVKRIYWDGVLAAETTGAANLPDPSASKVEFLIGARCANTTDMANKYHCALNGSVAHVSLWNTALTQTEVGQLLAKNPAGTETNLIGYWPCDEVGGTTVYDRSSGGNNGTIVGSRYTRTLDYDCFNGAAADVCFDEVGDTNFTARVRIHSLADGATAAVKLAWGPAADDLRFTNEVGTVTSAGEIVSTTVASADLSQTNYFAKVLMESSGLRRESSVVTFSTDGFPWADYQKLEYIESTGTQLIDTDWLPTQYAMIRFEAQFPQDFQRPASGAQHSIVGASDSTADDAPCFTINFGGNAAQDDVLFYWLDKPQAGGGKFSTLTGSPALRKSRAVVFADARCSVIRWGDVYGNIAGGQKTSDNAVSTFALFGRRAGGTYGPFNIGVMRLYSCMIWDDQKVKRDFVPCCEKGGLRRAGLWDRVEGKFHPNAMANGTDFVRGPRIKLPWQRVGFMLLFR